MRALILRRVALIENGTSGPVLIGPALNPDMVRLQNFLARNGYPHQTLGSLLCRCRRGDCLSDASPIEEASIIPQHSIK